VPGSACHEQPRNRRLSATVNTIEAMMLKRQPARRNWTAISGRFCIAYAQEVRGLSGSANCGLTRGGNG